MKKILSLVLALTVIFSVLSFGSFQASAATYGMTGDCLWTLDGTVLTISGEGEMGNYAIYESLPWGTSITEVIIEEGVTFVGRSAFFNCENLKSVSLPSTLTVIGCNAFGSCISLENVTIPQSVLEIENLVFSSCSSIKSIIIPENVIRIGSNAFALCENLSEITFPDNVAQIDGSAFSSTKWYYNLPSGIVYIGNILYGYKGTCPETVEVKEGTVCIADSAFEGSNLKKVIIPASVDFIGHRAFANTNRLEEITIEDSDVTVYHSAFVGSSYYKNDDNWENGVLYIDNHLIKAKTDIIGFYEIKEGTKTIAYSAFEGCTRLTGVYIPESVESIGDTAFYNTEYYNTQKNWDNGVLYNGNYLIRAMAVPFEHYTIKSGTKVIADFAFYSINIPSITIPSSVEHIGEMAFYYGEGLEKVYYDGTETDKENITIRAFNYDLTRIPWRNPSKKDWVLEDGKWAFYEDGLKLKNCWKEDTVGWVYIGEDGYMLTNAWVRDSVTWCFVGEDGYCVTNAWRKDSKGWVYLDEVGRMKTNAWVRDSAGWCYVGDDGYAETNCWKKDSIGWIWLNSEGSMTKDSWILYGGKWYYLDADGYMVSNVWRKDSTGWIYLGTDGAMLTDSWVMDYAGWCYVGSDGYAVTNCWMKDSIGWCYLTSEGSMLKNDWVLHEGKWYYLDENGYRVTDSKTINGKLYYFNEDGTWSGDNQSMDGFGPWQ